MSWRDSLQSVLSIICCPKPLTEDRGKETHKYTVSPKIQALTETRTRIPTLVTDDLLRKRTRLPQRHMSPVLRVLHLWTRTIDVILASDWSRVMWLTDKGYLLFELDIVVKALNLLTAVGLPIPRFKSLWPVCAGLFLNFSIMDSLQAARR